MEAGPQADQEAEEILLRIRRDINCLVDADRVVRRSALTRIENSLCADNTKVLEETVSRIYFDALAHNLHKAVEDSVEGCRERAIRILGKILERIVAVRLSGAKLITGLNYRDFREGEGRILVWPDLVVKKMVEFLLE